MSGGMAIYGGGPGTTMNEPEIALKVLIRKRHMSYDAFCREWDRVAKNVDSALKGTYPRHAQYYRWLRGQLVGKRPYPDACRILEAMFQGWSVESLFSPYSGEILKSAPSENLEESRVIPEKENGERIAGRFSDLSAAFIGRADFMSEVSLFDKLDSASLVRASGLSLNLLTQHYPDSKIRRLVENGTRFQLIFLNPQSEAMKLREEEEGYQHGFLGGLTEVNIKVMRERIQARLDSSIRDQFTLAVSDEIIRFNIILVDDNFGVFQPYLPEARGVDSPTFVMETDSPGTGFFHVFDQVFTSLWKRATII